MKLKLFFSLLIVTCFIVHAEDDGNSSGGSGGNGNDQVVEEITCVAEDLKVTSANETLNNFFNKIKEILQLNLKYEQYEDIENALIVS